MTNPVREIKQQQRLRRHHLFIFLSLQTTTSLHPRCEASSNAYSEGVHEPLNAAVVTEATTINNKLHHTRTPNST
ncbi:unnamed protein product [Linum trigynum]|uniref:Secreted protein n=1 Tax=Linum trigynum TaxID=586398 RepID=A0AAV2E0M8_9ROSI